VLVSAANPLSPAEAARIDAYWRAANYLSVGQIYLMDNPLLREPIRPEHVKPRLLGHWGTTPGLNVLYAHLNRIIRDRGYTRRTGEDMPEIRDWTWPGGS
jgi:xylulose-5-phosphate/fructose-6-phosphate phosphoketolase